MKLSLSRQALTDYSGRVHQNAGLLRWAGNVHLRNPSPYLAIKDQFCIQERSMLSQEETASALEKFSRLRQEEFAADQRESDLDGRIGASLVKLPGEETATYRATSVKALAGDPEGTFELQTADIDQFGHISQSIAMRNGKSWLEVAVVENLGDKSYVQEYVFFPNSNRALYTEFSVNRDLYDQRTLGDKARESWNGLF